MPTKKRPGRLLGRSVRFWAGVVAAVCVFAVLVHSDAFTDKVEVVATWAEDLIRDHPLVGALVFFLLSALSALLGAASSVVLVPPATEVWGRVLTFALLWGGWMTGTMIAYWIGGRARPLMAKLGVEKELAQFAHFVTKRTKLWLIALFCLAAPTEVAGYLLGSIRYPFAKFVLAMGISEAVFAVGVIVAGESLLDANPLVLLSAGLALIAVAVGAGLVFRKMRKR